MKKLGAAVIIFFSLNSSAQNVGIGTNLPAEKLDVNGNLKADTVKTNVLKIAPNAAAGKLLTSDANGNASWQAGAGAVKAYNGLTKSNDTINIGGRLYNDAELRLAQNNFTFSDIGTNISTPVNFVPAGSSNALSATPIVQTFLINSNCKLWEIDLNITALAGGQITLSLLDDNLAVIGSFTKNYVALTNVAEVFPVDAYLEAGKIYQLSVTGNSNAFLNYNASPDLYPGGSASLGATSDLSFRLMVYDENALLALSAGKVGIGTVTPAEKLDVTGNIKASGTVISDGIQMTNGAGAGKVLTSDAAGNASWVGSNAIPGTIAQSGNIHGQAFTNIPTVTNTWEFIGPSTTVTVNGNQRIVMNVSTAFGRNAAGAVNFRFDVGYQLNSSGAIINCSSTNYVIYRPAFAALEQQGFSATGSAKPPAGTYKIGAVINSTAVGAVNYNDFVNTTYMIINE